MASLLFYIRILRLWQTYLKRYSGKMALPCVSDIRLFRRAQPETACAVLIAVTGYGQEHDREATRAAGFNHHLVKPLDPDRF